MTEPPIRVLYIDDSRLDRELVRASLDPTLFELHEAANRAQFDQALLNQTYDVVLSDFNILGFTGLDVVRVLRDKQLDLPIVILTGTGSEDVAVEAMKNGVSDYVIKQPSHVRRLNNTLANAVAAHRLQSRHKEIEGQLRKLSQAVEQSPAAVVITDMAGVVEYVNPRFTAITGYQAHEVVGQKPNLLKSGKHPREFYEELWTTIKAGLIWHGEFCNRKADGTLYWESASISPIRNDTGEITHFVAVKEDVTQRRRLEDELRHAQKMEAMGRLAGGVAHDFNNLLTGIIGFTQLLIADEPDAARRRDLEEVSQLGERAAALTRQLLTFSRKQPLERRVLDLNDLIQNVLKLLRRLIGEDIELVFNPASGSLNVLGDPGQLEQVLSNLAVNARDAMPNGGRLTLETRLIELEGEEDHEIQRGLPDGTYVLLTVADTGVGMESDVRERIFEPFFTTKEMGRGTGLGLSTVYGIVKHHGGDVGAASALGEGTVFSVLLPLAPEADPAVTSAERRRPVLNLRGLETILVVEDDPGVLEFASRVLSSHGYRLLRATNSSDAQALYLRHRPEVTLLLTDVVMPGGNGRDLYHILHAQAPELKVLYMSGYTDEVIAKHGVLEPGASFLAKPFTAWKLLTTVRETLDGFRL